MSILIGLFGFLMLGSISTFAADSDFCITQSKMLEYSFTSRSTVECNGVQIKESAFLGKGLEEKFQQKLKKNGLNIIIDMSDANSNRYIVSKKSRKDFKEKELCVATKSQPLKSFILKCDSQIELLITYSKDDALENFAKSYNYHILQKPSKNKDFYILGR